MVMSSGCNPTVAPGMPTLDRPVRITDCPVMNDDRGEFELALMRSDEAVYIADAIDQFATRIYAYMALGIVHLRRGSFDFAIQPLERAFQLSERADLRMARAMVAGYLGRAYPLTKQVSRAIEILNRT